MTDKPKGEIVLRQGEETILSLAATANSEHEQVERSSGLIREGAEGMVGHAIVAGEALIKIKESLPHGTWGTWLTENFTASQETARIYMRFAENRLALAGISNYAEAMQAVKQITQADRPSLLQRKRDANTARKLAEEGMTLEVIAGRFGVGAETVRRWLNPKLLVEQRDYQRARKKMIRREQQEQAAARQKGKPLAEAYALTRRATQQVERAERRATSTQRAILIEVGEALYLAEDKLGEALRK